MDAKKMCQYWGEGHNVRLPPAGFVAALHASFPELLVRWDNAMERWQICEIVERRTSVGRRIMEVMLVQGPNGEPRELDQRVLERLHEMDTHFGEGKEAYLLKLREGRLKKKATDKADIDDRIREMSKEAGKYLVNCPEHLRGY